MQFRPLDNSRQCARLSNRLARGYFVTLTPPAVTWLVRTFAAGVPTVICLNPDLAVVDAGV